MRNVVVGGYPPIGGYVIDWRGGSNLCHIAMISISSHMAVRVIWDISPDLCFTNFEIIPSVSEGDFEIDKRWQGWLIYPKSHEQSCDSWLIIFSMINTKQSPSRRQINWWLQIRGWGGWLQQNQLTLRVRLHAKMWLYKLFVNKGL